MELLSGKNTEKRSTIVLFVVLSYFFILASWAIVSYAHIVKPLILPQPHIVFLEIARMFISGNIIDDLLITLLRISLGLIISLILAIPIGICVGLYKKYKALFNPLAVLRYLPYSALIPLSILWLGIGETQKISIIVIAEFTYLFMLIADAVSRVPSQIIDTAYTLGASDKDVIKKVILPYCAPIIYDNAKLAFAIGWIVIIFVEMVGAEKGIGHMIMQSQRYLQTPRVIAGILIIGAIGFLADYLFNRMYKLLFPWSEKGGLDA